MRLRQYSHRQRVITPDHIDWRIRRGLIGCWIPQVSGNTMIDRSGRGNHGALNGPPLWTLDPRFDIPGMQISTTQFVDFGDIDIVDGLSSISCSFWINVNGAGVNDGRIVGKGGTSAATQAVFFTIGPSPLQSRIAISDGTKRVIKDTQTFAFGTFNWFHMAFVWYGGDTCDIYINAVAQSLTTILAETPTTINPTAKKFRIGADEDAVGFNGMVGPVLMHDRALTLAEVKMLADPYFQLVRPRRIHPEFNPVVRSPKRSQFLTMFPV